MRKEEQKQRAEGRGYGAREPAKGLRSAMENDYSITRGLIDGWKRKRRSNIGTVDADPDQQGGNQEAGMGARDIGGSWRGSIESASLLSHLIKVFFVTIFTDPP